MSFKPTQRTKSEGELIKRFQAKIGPPDENGCRPWLAGKNGDGYGYFALTHTKSIRAHAFAWELANGPVPPGKILCHTCDNRWCCEPSHVYPGTHAQNQADKRVRGRAASGDRNGMRTHPGLARGSKNPSAILTEAKVAEIRKALGSGRSQQSIANDFGVSQPTVSRVKLGVKGGWGWMDGSHPES